MKISRRSFVAATAAAASTAGPLSMTELVAGGRAWCQEPKRSPAGEGDSAKVQAAMRAIARSVRLRDLAGDPPGRVLSLREEPLLRYSDPPRAIFDATLWAWVRRDGGRPWAALKVEHQPTRPPQRRWIQGLVSLAPERIEATFHDGQTWASTEPGLVPRPIPGAAAPAASAVRRLGQARDLMRRFAVSEYAGVAVGRLMLRIMPRPLLRYSDPDAGVLDGFLFAFAYGTNPDVLLVLEAHDRTSPPGWQYGIGRLGGAEGSVELDGQKVWSVTLGNPPQQLATYMNRWVAEGDEPQ